MMPTFPSRRVWTPRELKRVLERDHTRLARTKVRILKSLPCKRTNGLRNEAMATNAKA